MRSTPAQLLRGLAEHYLDGNGETTRTTELDMAQRAHVLFIALWWACAMAHAPDDIEADRRAQRLLDVLRPAPTKPVWLYRNPTEAEVIAHAAAHPVFSSLGHPNGGLWRTKPADRANTSPLFAYAKIRFGEAVRRGKPDGQAVVLACPVNGAAWIPIDLRQWWQGPPAWMPCDKDGEGVALEVLNG